MIPVDELIALTGATEADADALEALERGAVAFVERQTDRYFGPPEEVTEHITGNGSRRLWLRDHPVIDDDYPPYGDFGAVEVIERPYPGGDATTLEESVYQLRLSDREFQLVRLGDSGYWTQPYEYAVTYWRGYEEGEEPADIRQLVADLVVVRWNIRAEGMTGLRSETLEGYSYTRFGNSDVDSVSGGWSTIEAWRRPVFA